MKLFSVWDTGLAGLDDEGIARRWGERAGADPLRTIARYRAGRPDAAPADIWVAVSTDWVFRIPAIRLLEAQLQHQPACWSYLFTTRSTAFGGMLGSCHALDIPYVFDTLDRPGVAMFTGNPEGAAELAIAMQEAWLAFARSGAPGHAGLPEWPRYDVERRSTMELGTPSRLLIDPNAAERVIWDGVR
ncbi:MAG: carboxylesterase family protein, partial [Acidimicrobiales bacterium]